MKRNIIDIYEGILGDVDDVLAKGDTDIAEVMVMDIINAVYRIKKSTKLEIIPVKNENGKYTVNAIGDVAVKDRSIKTLVNDVFEWGEVDGNFSVWKCINLTNLEGSPKSLTGGYNANSCSKLVSLEGAPEQTKDFFCVNCASLKTLKGAPKCVLDDFNCSYCPALTTLEGAPEIVTGEFNCSQCNNLRTLAGISMEIGNGINARGCDKLINVGTPPRKIYGKIYVPAAIYVKTVETFGPICRASRSFSSDQQIFSTL